MNLSESYRNRLRELAGIEKKKRITLSPEEVFNMFQWQDSYKDLYPGYSEENEYGEDYMFDSKEQALEWYSGMVDMFESLPEPIPIYRAISAKSKEDIDEWWGYHWSFRRESALEFGVHNMSNFLLSGKVYSDNVDWEQTVRTFIGFSGLWGADDENEIHVDDPEKVIDVKIEEI